MIQFLPLIGPVIERLANLIPDPTERAKAVAQAQTEMLTALSASDTSQSNVNAEEAKHRSLFVAGWRPMAGWVCSLGLFYEIFLRTLLPWLASLNGIDAPPLPALGDSLWGLLFGMLGLGSLRSFEKSRGVTR